MKNLFPRIFNFYELNHYLILSKNNPNLEGKYFHPYNKILKYNNNNERKKLKRTKILIQRFIKSKKSFKYWIFERSETNYVDFIADLMKLFHHSTYLGGRYLELAQNRNYFVNIQGSIFWINLVKNEIVDLIKKTINNAV